MIAFPISLFGLQLQYEQLLVIIDIYCSRDRSNSISSLLQWLLYFLYSLSIIPSFVLFLNLLHPHDLILPFFNKLVLVSTFVPHTHSHNQYPDVACLCFGFGSLHITFR